MFSVDDSKSNSRGGTASSIDSGLESPVRRQRTRGITECEEAPEHQFNMKEKLDKAAR